MRGLDIRYRDPAVRPVRSINYEDDGGDKLIIMKAPGTSKEMLFYVNNQAVLVHRSDMKEFVASLQQLIKETMDD